MRLASTKYLKTGVCKTVHESLEKLFDDHLNQYFKTFDSGAFRREKLWCEECDVVFKRNLNAIKSVLLKYSGKYSTPGQLKYMSLDEFSSCLQDSGVLNESFVDREIS